MAFPDLRDAEFADAYAQTITFGLLLARREGIGFDGLEIPDIGEKLASRNLLVGRALSILTARPNRGKSMEDRSIILQTMRRVIGAADWTQLPTDRTYHWLYEEFLSTYDPAIRRKMGVYYTPPEVARFMVNFIDEILQEKLGVTRGVADPSVVVLDPAMGTGTFLQGVIERVAEVTSKEHGDVPGSLRALLTRLIGFERQIGPFAVAQLKLDQTLASYEAEVSDDELFRLYITDTLDDPNKAPLPKRGRVYAPLADSRRGANHVKTHEDVMVVLGNPPYRANAKKVGKWILDRQPGHKSLLDDFRLKGNGRRESKLHDLAIYFWRWALWKAFESTTDRSGIVAFITTTAYLDGPAFAGMRRYLRQQADYGWIIDLSTEGHWSSSQTRIFPGVPHPVCIGVFARGHSPDQRTSAQIRYYSIAGRQKEKFHALKDVHVEGTAWLKGPREWSAPLAPVQDDAWTSFPAVDDLVPYKSLGITCNRSWVHAPDRSALVTRWRRLVRADPQVKRELMKETRDRTIERRMTRWPGEEGSASIRDEASEEPRVERIGFRSFDRQYLITDQRVVDFPRQDLWRLHGNNQVYMITNLGKSLTSGPAVVFSADVPDVDFFRGNHNGRAFPLYRGSTSMQTNIPPGLFEFLEDTFGRAFGAEDVISYIAGTVAHAGYTARFHRELGRPGLRVPLTSDPDLWMNAAEIGKRIIWLHTFGERFYNQIDNRPWRALPNRPGVQDPIPGTPEEMPQILHYEEDSGLLVLTGTSKSGRVGPVSPRAANYDVCGMRVIQHWFNYRKRSPVLQKKATLLDTETADRWTLAMTEELRDLIAVLEGCVALEERQVRLLDHILEGPLLGVPALEQAGVLPVPDSARRPLLDEDELRLF